MNRTIAETSVGIVHYYTVEDNDATTFIVNIDAVKDSFSFVVEAKPSTVDETDLLVAAFAEGVVKGRKQGHHEKARRLRDILDMLTRETL